MKRHTTCLGGSIGLLVLCAATASAGLTPEAKCEALKNKEAGKYAFCLQKAEMKLAKTAGSCTAPLGQVCYQDEECDPNETCTKDTQKYGELVQKCNDKFTEKWAKWEQKALDTGTTCPTTQDRAALQTIITERAAQVQAALDEGLACPFKSSGCEESSVTRFVDNGDGTATDLYSGLMWEVKTGTYGSPGEICPGGTTCADPHDVNNRYGWTAGATAPDGPAFTLFLDTLNDVAGGGQNCFAGYCDWRLPTVHELKRLLLEPESDGSCSLSPPCVDDSLPGETASEFYWSSTTSAGYPIRAWRVGFSVGGDVSTNGKTDFEHVRAVRGGL